ncbi:MAG: uracil phosphoribosyltransferase [Chloroflexota bacterium]|nr:uracil phosphoribosyltransferase [Chloroflexota bacterium]
MAPQVHVSAHPLVKHKMGLLRDQRTDPKKFRELLREISVLLTYEATADLATEEVSVITPLGQSNERRLVEQVGLVPILRAGLGMVEGVWNSIPNAEVWHIGLRRDEQTLQPIEYYARLPVSPTVDVCLVLDPMLATGGSATAAIDILKEWGTRRIKFVGVIASTAGIRHLSDAHPDVPLFLAAVDEQLNDAGLIVPGLGDAGDRLFGTG